jgi:hypothetical protein
MFVNEWYLVIFFSPPPPVGELKKAAVGGWFGLAGLVDRCWRGWPLYWLSHSFLFFFFFFFFFFCGARL